MDRFPMLNKIIAAGFVLALATPAIASDLPSGRETPAPAPLSSPIFAPFQPASWTGFYAGVEGGYGIWDKYGAAPKNSMVGIRAGYDYQVWNNIVVGVVGTGDLNFGRKTVTVGANYSTVNQRYTLAIDGRLGYAFDDQTMAYALGGYTNLNFKTKTSIYTAAVVGPPAVAAFTTVTNVSDNSGAWNIGAGVEHKFTQNVSLFAEYRYNSIFQNGAGKFHEIQGGALYRF
jgi:outer membrane immunogenic protein